MGVCSNFASSGETFGDAAGRRRKGMEMYREGLAQGEIPGAYYYE